MRPRSSWWGAHKTLKRLYAERIGEEVTYKDFGRRYGLGTASMVAQLLNGVKPLSIDAATKFAKAFRCDIGDFCPEMAEYLRTEVMPCLGKALRRAAVVLLALLLQQFASFDAKASTISHNVARGAHQFAKSLNTLHIVAHWILQIVQLFVQKRQAAWA
jgi:transcriptional regulator with XRE-family HTH domain